MDRSHTVHFIGELLRVHRPAFTVCRKPQRATDHRQTRLFQYQQSLADQSPGICFCRARRTSDATRAVSFTGIARSARICSNVSPMMKSGGTAPAAASARARTVSLVHDAGEFPGSGKVGLGVAPIRHDVLRVEKIRNGLVGTGQLAEDERYGKPVRAELERLGTLQRELDPESAARLRPAWKLKLADAVQAASAFAVGADAPVTHDRDFSALRDLRVLGVQTKNPPA